MRISHKFRDTVDACVPLQCPAGERRRSGLHVSSSLGGLGGGLPERIYPFTKSLFNLFF